MARSPYSPSPSPGLESSHPSESSDEDDLSMAGETLEVGPSISRPGSPTLHPDGGQLEEDIEGDTMACQWEECGKVFNHLPSLIEHIHNDHIGVHKSNYTCEWKTCPRRGIAQTSRFALISHIRSHTGEKPFICPRPECDKSFTRSDALAKHMRIQHGIVPPLPGRGGNRKRKREEPDMSVQGPDGYTTFKVEPHPQSELHLDDDEIRMSPFEVGGDYHNGISIRRSVSPDSVDGDDLEDGIPPHLMALMDPATGLIMGRSPYLVKYILMKAKYQYALQEHESLIEELRTFRNEERCWRQRKDALLDEVMRVMFGPQAEELTFAPAVAPPHPTRVDLEEP